MRTGTSSLMDYELVKKFTLIDETPSAPATYNTNIDLPKMEQKLDEALANETSESLTDWIESKREDDVEKLNNRLDKLETLAKLLAKSWFYCDWRWENPNERVMQMLMQDLGLYPFKDEDEMIQQTKIDEGLDKELYKEASIRIPTYGKLSEDLVENPFNFVCTTPDCPHCIEELNQMEDDGLTDDEWIIREKHKEIETTAINFVKWISGQYSYGNIFGKWYLHENTSKEYTEEELFEIYKQSKQ